MDILTPKGLKTIEHVAEAIAIWQKHYPKLEYNETPNKKPADIDGIITCSGQVRAVVETKCRMSISMFDFKEEYDSKWLVTFDKVTRAINIAEALKVPFVGFLYFPAEKTLLVQSIFNPDDGMQVEMQVKRTRTQATVNGGLVWRDNAYIDMKSAKSLA